MSKYFVLMVKDDSFFNLTYDEFSDISSWITQKLFEFADGYEMEMQVYSSKLIKGDRTIYIIGRCDEDTYKAIVPELRNITNFDEISITEDFTDLTLALKTIPKKEIIGGVN